MFVIRPNYMLICIGGCNDCRYGEEVWTQKVVYHCTTLARTNRKAMPGKVRSFPKPFSQFVKYLLYLDRAQMVIFFEIKHVC